MDEVKHSGWREVLGMWCEVGYGRLDMGDGKWEGRSAMWGVLSEKL